MGKPRDLACVSVAALLLSACAKESKEIRASYVSPIKYNSYSCSQMEQEYARVMAQSGQINRQQDDIASNDSVAMGIGMVLFWPALFFIEGDDHREEVGRLKGEVNAIEQASIQKDCSNLAKRVEDDRVTAQKAADAKKKLDEEQFK